jgi:hypothetical protein
MEQWWNDTDRGILKHWQKNIIQRPWYFSPLIFYSISRIMKWSGYVARMG